jgi:hypothetical protein
MPTLEIDTKAEIETVTEALVALIRQYRPRISNRRPSSDEHPPRHCPAPLAGGLVVTG